MVDGVYAAVAALDRECSTPALERGREEEREKRGEERRGEERREGRRGEKRRCKTEKSMRLESRHGKYCT